MGLDEESGRGSGAGRLLKNRPAAAGFGPGVGKKAWWGSATIPVFSRSKSKRPARHDGRGGMTRIGPLRWWGNFGSSLGRTWGGRRPGVDTGDTGSEPEDWGPEWRQRQKMADLLRARRPKNNGVGFSTDFFFLLMVGTRKEGGTGAPWPVPGGTRKQGRRGRREI